MPRHSDRAGGKSDTGETGHTHHMNPATASELRALCKWLGEPFDAGLSEAEARERIEALRGRDG